MKYEIGVEGANFNPFLKACSMHVGNLALRAHLDYLDVFSAQRGGFGDCEVVRLVLGTSGKCWDIAAGGGG